MVDPASLGAFSLRPGYADSFAKAAYPAMKEAATFYLDYLTDDDGSIISSPDRRFRPGREFLSRPRTAPKGVPLHGSLDRHPDRPRSFHALHGRVASAQYRPGIPRTAWRRLAKLPPHKIDKFGQLMEWQEEYEEIEIGHRHLSHLFAVFPSEQVTPRPDARIRQCRPLASLLRRGDSAAGRPVGRGHR